MKAAVAGTARALRAAALAAACTAGACGGDAGDGSASPALLELERLAFVAPAVRSVPGYRGPTYDCTIERAILVDRYEVTRADWLLWTGDDEEDPVRARWFDASGDVPEETLAWPATWMTRAEAQEVARRRSMRLCTAREWVHVAVGHAGLPYPWGFRPQAAFANGLELGLGRLAPVGTFETGRAPTVGCYDLLGNAAEWIADWAPSYADAGAEPPIPGRTGAACAFGGGFADATLPTFGPSKTQLLGFHAVTLDPEHRGADVGFRCAADARTYLLARAADWGRGAEARRRVAAVAQRWVRTVGREPVQRVLRDVEAVGDAPAGIAWLAEGAR